MAVFESPYCRLCTFCVKFRAEGPAVVHFGHMALPVTMKRMAILPSTSSFVVLGGVAAPWVLKKDSAALAENTIGRIRKLAQ